MKTIRTVGLGLALLAGGAGFVAAQQVAGFDTRELFEQLDANHDKTIVKTEVPESALPAFEQLLQNGDTNKNGKLELDEYRALVDGLRGQPGPAPAGAGGGGDRFRELDANRDGKLSRAEFGGAEQAFERMDTDMDGFISREEATRFQAENSPEMILQRLKGMDKNGDGKVSKDEFTGPEPQFARLDVDRDGFISKDEAEKFVAATLNTPGPFFKAMDKNGDGKIGRDEFTGPLERFDRLDTNKDGALTLQEFRTGQQLINMAPKKDEGAGKKPGK